MPAAVSASLTLPRVRVLETICPFVDSIRRTVPSATAARLASVACCHPSMARAARRCLPVKFSSKMQLTIKSNILYNRKFFLLLPLTILTNLMHNRCHED